jgi:hypothetical protein
MCISCVCAARERERWRGILSPELDDLEGLDMVARATSTSEAVAAAAKLPVTTALPQIG